MEHDPQMMSRSCYDLESGSPPFLLVSCSFSKEVVNEKEDAGDHFIP